MPVRGPCTLRPLSCAMRSHDVVPMPVRGPDTLKRRTLKLGQPSCGMPSRCLTMPVNGLHTLRPKAETVRRHHACQEALYLETALAISRAEPRRNNTISMLVRGPCTLRRVACPHVLMPVKRLDILRQQVPVLLTMPVRGPCTLRQSESSALVGSNACQEALYLETMCCPHFAVFYHHASQGALYPETTPTDPLWFPANACSQCLSGGLIP
jgi:hypothetical protein